MNTTLKKYPSIVIADKHPLSLSGIKYFIHSQGPYKVMETKSASKLKNIIKTNKATHLISNMGLVEDSSITLIKNLRTAFPDLQILFYNISSDKLELGRKFECEADCFLSEKSSEKEIMKTLSSFLKDNNTHKLNARSAKGQFDPNPLSPFDKLSDREMDTLHYLLKGYRIKAIAEKMKLRSNTVATFKQRIFKKLKISNPVELYKIAQENERFIFKQSFFN